MTKNKKLKNKKRYLGNPFTVAFLPVLAAAGLTLGATGMSLKGAASEESKQHDIVLPQPTETGGWKVSAYNNQQQVTRARKGELITFVVQEQAYVNEEGDEPTAIKINNIPYKLLDGGSFKYVDVEIPFIETMTISLDFTKEPEFLWTVTFRTHPTDPEICYKIKAITGAYVDRPTDPAVENYEFVGWYKDASFNEEWDFAHDKITQNTIIYSKWNALSPLLPHTVTKIDMPDQPGKRDTWELTAPETAKLTDVMDIHVDVKSGKTPTVYFPQAVTINGRLFPLQKVSDTQYKPVIEIVCPFMVDMTIEVLFDHILPDSHLVSFDSQGGTSVATQNVKTGETAKEPTGEDIPTKEHYKFVGWCTDKECVKPFNFSNPITKDITLYADWHVVKNWQITFIKDPEKPAETEVLSLPDGTMPTHADPTKTKEGHVYTFQHWLGREDEEPHTESIGIQKATKNITYTAVFDDYHITYPVVFETGYETIVPTQSVKHGETAKDPELTRIGYEDVEWYDNAAKTGTAYSFDTPVTAPLKLYAKWTPKKFNVKFMWYNGTADVEEDIQFDFDSMPTHETPSKTKSGYDYVFTNWKNVTDPEHITYGLSKVPAHDNTVYEAEFEEIPRGFVVSFDTCGGDDMPPQTVMPGKCAIEIEPKKGSYKFDGWYDIDPTGKEEEELVGHKWNFATPINSHMTLYAKWKDGEEPAESFTVSFNQENTECTITAYKGENTAVQIPNTFKNGDKDVPVTKIGDNAFLSNELLKEVILPKTVHTIGNKAFQSCTSLSRINTEHVATLGYQAFAFTENIKTFTITDENLTFTPPNGRQFFSSGIKTITFEHSSTWNPDNPTKNLVFTKTEWMFGDCAQLKEVFLPNRFDTAGMGNYMFSRTDVLLTSIKFEGTPDDWNTAISGTTSWNPHHQITKVYCYNRDKTGSKGITELTV